MLTKKDKAVLALIILATVATIVAVAVAYSLPK